MIHKINVFLLSLIVAFAPAYVMAVELPPNNSWSWKHHNKQREKKRLLAHLTKTVNEAGSKKTIVAVVETKPTASKVGSAMMKRIAVSPGGAAIGVYAVTQLIEAIGWVMEDGTYVKKIPKETNDRTCEYLYSYQGKELCRDELAAAANKYYKDMGIENARCGIWGNAPTTNIDCALLGGTVATPRYRLNPNYNNEPETKDVPLTPTLLGAAMLGSGYVDPDPNFDNDTVNTDGWTGVPEAYTPDPSGVGNELADELENKADRSPKTADGEAAPIGDPEYQNPLDSNDDANDRQWGGEDGTEGSTDNTEKIDPETGEKTQQGTFKLPKFCDWAMTVCEWYEGWKKTDVKVNQHIDDTKQHQTEEKSFWQSVKDWFNWTKEDDLPEKELPDEVPEQTDLELLDKINSVNFNGSAYCPPDIEVPISFSGLGSSALSISYQPLCHMAVQARPIVILISWLLGAYIITGRNMREGD